jgi:hypothetical protein
MNGLVIFVYDRRTFGRQGDSRRQAAFSRFNSTEAILGLARSRIDSKTVN